MTSPRAHSQAGNLGSRAQISLLSVSRCNYKNMLSSGRTKLQNTSWQINFRKFFFFFAVRSVLLKWCKYVQKPHLKQSKHNKMERQVKHSPYWHYIAKGRVRDGGQNSAVSVQVLFGVTHVFLSSFHVSTSTPSYIWPMRSLFRHSTKHTVVHQSRSKHMKFWHFSSRNTKALQLLINVCKTRKAILKCHSTQ